ncbi:Sm-like ribonucleoprotein [Trichodelitschia bisporula]|uniref:Sm protein B n=1 Tax=Trichodelitschia bisporula TaxID=703511 RepID=A0A6G1IBW5_9PEZI|nr:Sm-like ribonucleoprotein [Trichodelitschia bisporula]
MTSANKQGKMQNYINYRVRITFDDGRQFAGQLMAFDKHMNLVIADTEEFRRVKNRSKKPGSGPDVEVEEKRTLGLTIIRGAHVVSLSIEGPPPADPSSRLGTSAPGGAGPGAALSAGPGISRPAGRGLPIGLTGPAPGVGGPAPPGFQPPFPPPGFGRGGAPGAPPGFGAPPAGFPAAGLPGGPPGFPQGPPPGFQPPQQGRGFPPPGFGGR